MFLRYPIPKSLSSGKGLGRFAPIYMWFIVLFCRSFTSFRMTCEGLRLRPPQDDMRGRLVVVKGGGCSSKACRPWHCEREGPAACGGRDLLLKSTPSLYNLLRQPLTGVFESEFEGLLVGRRGFIHRVGHDGFTDGT